MTVKFNPADYADDDIIDNHTVERLTRKPERIIISGWSREKVDLIKLNSLLLENGFSSHFEPSAEIFHNDTYFYRLDIIISDGDISIINGAEKSWVDKWKLIIKYCLIFFKYSMNVALACTKKEDDKEQRYIYYQTRVTGNELEHQIKLLETLLASVPKEAKLNLDSQHPYFFPGIELVSGKSIGPKNLKYLSKEIQKSNLFFDLPYSVLSNTFHLYHHPKNSFPLPVLLKSSQDMEKAEYWKGIDWKDDYQDYLNDFRKYKKYIVLGYYTRDNEDGCEGPHIVLCPENIEDAASDSNLKDKKELLYLIVLIHELAHAMMDKNNVTLNTLFSNAMEESLANMIALQWFDVFDEQNKDNVKDFINDNQPKIYKFGINQFEATVDWRRWRDCNKNMRDKLEYWFNKCFEGGEIRNIESSAVKTEYDNVFL